MATRKSPDTAEQHIRWEEILILKDDRVNHYKVCMTIGAGTGTGRAAAIEVVANKLMTVGL